MRQNTFYTLGLCLMGFVCSCVSENTNECFYGLRLNFVSTLYDAEGEPNHKPDISSVKVFVFDADNVLCAAASGAGNCLAPSYTLDVALPPGTYKVMVWGNSSPDFSRSYVEGAESRPVTIGHTRLSDFLLELKCYADEKLSDRWLPSVVDFDDLYFGMVGNRTSATSVYSIEDVIIPEYNIVKKQVDLMRNTNRLKILITGAQNLNVDKENIEVYAEGYNRGYIFDNCRNEKIGAVKYTAENLPGTNQIWNFEIKTQRIEANTYANKPLILYLSDKRSGQIIYNLNVVETLLEVRDNDGNFLYENQEAFDRKYVHSIELKIEGDGSSVQIRIFINGWEIKTIYPAGKL